MAAVPVATPLTMPPEVTVATPVAPLLQAPPVVASISDKVEPIQMVGDEGEIGETPGVTVTDSIEIQVPIA